MENFNIDDELHNDLIIKIIKYFTTEKLIQIGSFLSTALIFYIIGKIFGQKNKDIIKALKQKYEMVGIKKKKLNNQISKLITCRSYISFLMKITVALIFGIFGLNFYLHDFSINFIYLFEMNYYTISILSLIPFTLLLMFCKYLCNKYLVQKRKIVATLDTNLNDITQGILTDLGPELAEILKQKLAYNVSSKERDENKMILIREEQKLKQQQEQLQKLINEHQQKLQQLAQTKPTVEKPSNELLLNIAIAQLDLQRHKDIVANVVNFDWCDDCLENGHRAPVNDENKSAEIAKLQDEEKVNGELDNQVESQEKNHINEEPHNKNNESQLICRKNCIYRYFQMAKDCGIKFQAQEEPINHLKNQLEKIASPKS